MNAELFIAFVLMTLVLILTPGPIVTLVIAIGATQGLRTANPRKSRVAGRCGGVVGRARAGAGNIHLPARVQCFANQE